MTTARILVTGAAGFIGYHLARRLCEDGWTVFGLDNLNDYYDPKLKEDRLKQLASYKNFTFAKADLADQAAIDKLFKEWKPEIVVNLAAQAGVRYSLTNPHAYTHSNIDGFLNILEACRHGKVKHLVFASSSSVYGANTKLPFATSDSVDRPISLYAATKKANELMAHSYAHLFGLPCTGLRFFTVYGPWGRPDMALYIFTRALYDGKPLDVFNNGNMKRDFTYIDDIIGGIMALIPLTPKAEPTPYKLYNIGNNKPELLTDAIRWLEEETGIKAKQNMLPMQPGDVMETYADIDELTRDTGFKPVTPLKKGIGKFVAWYRDYHKLGNRPAA
jgi:UDP-glucuronate 4-epimerase